jgi:hypothetical protein
MIDVLDAIVNFIQSNSDGVFTIIGVIIGSVGAYLIAESGRKEYAKSLRANLAQGYCIEIQELELLIIRVLAHEPGAMPKSVSFYPDSGLFHSTRKETLQFPWRLYSLITQFYNIILKAEYHRHESLYSAREGMKDYEIRRLELTRQITAISNNTGHLVPESEIKKMLEELKATCFATGQLAFSNSLEKDIEHEFQEAQKLIPELKTLLTKEMD